MARPIPDILGNGPQIGDHISLPDDQGQTEVRHPLTTALLRQQWPYEHYHLLGEMLKVLLMYYLEERELMGHQTRPMQDKARSLVVILMEILECGVPVKVGEVVYRSR